MEKFYQLCRAAAAEGAVLLKNDNQMLPIQAGEKVSIFGRCQIDTYRSGTGSGGAVNVPYSVSILDGIKSSGIAYNSTLAECYRHWIAGHPFDNGGGGWAAEPWNQEEMPLTEELLEAARAVSDKAVFIIGRTAGEDQDNLDKAGSYRLTGQEEENLTAVCRYFERVAVVLNTANIIDMSWSEKVTADAILYIWQGGMETGSAAADLLSGRIVPSGKLPDTIAAALSDYPSDRNFGSMEKNYYQEDIYVGYRYFETFAPERVRYPFGYGLSYTSFELAVVKAEVDRDRDDDTIRIEVKVTNSGSDYTGKEVVQVYYSAPQGVLGKPLKELAGFAKTGLLAPGESQVVTITFPVSDMASYDDGGLTGYKSCFVLEAGSYRIYAGSSIREVQPVTFDGADFIIRDLQVLKRCRAAVSPIEDFQRFKPRQAGERFELAYEAVPLRSYSLRERIEENLPEPIEQTGDRGYRLTDVRAGKISLQEFVAQLTTGELAILVRGEGMGSRKVTLGTASAFGGVGDSLLDYGIPVACCADGPSGARIESGVKTTQVPIGTLFAAGWNTAIVREVYRCMGQELRANQIDTLLGPGMNIHRHPRNGRNFEYFSEDPLLTGMMATAVLEGLREEGIEATVKHFAANNQETNRYNVESVVSERALREIYLRPFELAVKQGRAASVMTTYNPVNGYWTASGYDLNTTVLREEWGFRGIVMTDWWAKMNDVTEGGEARKNNTAAMIRAQNDLYMVVNNNGAEINSDDDNILSAIEEGTLTVAELQRSAVNILSFILAAPVMERPLKAREKPQRHEALAQLPENPIISDHSRILFEGNRPYYFEITTTDIYSFIVSIAYDQHNLFQSACNVYLNGRLLANVNANGTEGQHIVQKLLEAELECGGYELSFDFVKPGMEIDYVEFRRK